MGARRVERRRGTKGKIIMTGGILILLGFLFLIGWGDRGALDLYQVRVERDRMRQANLELQKKNEVLFRAIQRLKNDLNFVESIARTELGMIAKDEVVILKKKR